MSKQVTIRLSEAEADLLLARATVDGRRPANLVKYVLLLHLGVIRRDASIQNADETLAARFGQSVYGENGGSSDADA